MSDKIGGVILAAGKGTRLKIKTPKPLLPIMGRKLIDYPLRSLDVFLSDFPGQGHIGLVVGHEKEKLIEHIEGVKKDLNNTVFYAEQKQQNGTADALKAYIEQVNESSKTDYILIMCADTPLIRSEDLEDLYNIAKDGSLDAVAASFILDEPSGYGRIIRHDKGFSIVEEKDADKDQKKISEVNSGLYLVRTDYIKEHLEKIDSNNSQGEFYLTDLFKKDRNVKAITFADGEIFEGVNTLVQLHDSERKLLKRKVSDLMSEGVRFKNVDSVQIDEDVYIDPGAVIHSNVTLEGKTHINENVIVESSCVIKNSIIGEDSHIKAGSYIVDSKIGIHVAIGPYAHLRPDSVIDNHCKIGNFVETKKSHLKEGAKVSHLSYVGDAEIGKETNIGCGFITCNYDGANKHKTTIGDNTFIGSDSQMIAPVTIGDNCYVASGSTINQDLKDGDFAIARARQVTKENMARKFLKKKK